MADATDSKSVEGNFMWVRLPPAAPDDHIIKRMAFRTIGVPENVNHFWGKGTNERWCFFLPSGKQARAKFVTQADATDSKSVEGNFMWVRLPPAAPDNSAWALFFVTLNFV